MSSKEPEEFRKKEKKKAKIVNSFSKELYFIFVFCFLILSLLIVVIIYLKTPEKSDYYTSIEKIYDVFVDFYGFLVSVIFAVFTYMTIREMKKTREQQNNPYLVVRLEPLGVSHTVLRIKNVGGGPALNINLKYSIKKDNKVVNESVWTHSLLQPTEFVRLVIEKKGIKEFYREYDSADFDMTYFNSENKKREHKIKLNLKELLKGIEDVFWIWERKTEDDIHSISDSLKKIKNSLDKVAKGIEYLSYENRKKVNKEFIERITKKKEKK